MKKIMTEIALERDVDSLVELENICFKTDKLSAKHFRYFIKKPSALVMIIKDHKQVVAATIALFRKNSRICRLYSIAVHPDYRKLGLAYVIHDFLERSARKYKCHAIRLEVRKFNYRAIKFYLKNGYEKFGEYENFYEDGVTATRMQKILSMR